MNEIEKAKLLIDKIYHFDDTQYLTDDINTLTPDEAKKIALIWCDEIIETLSDNSLYIQGETNINELIEYWKQVRLKVMYS